ncbi:MAG: serine/threonine-protein kinase [Eubacteriales bacterium]|nr:serine/threonine-protein kinase [Eubacteriales bacterium]MDD4444195.1 serine/threonine-protein kinase [Eubacteriales bacterium]
MNDVKAAVSDIENAFDTSRYPAGFLEQYDQLECLAASHGTETFLVRPKDGEKLFVAKCYDKSIYSVVHESNILKGLNHNGLPAFSDEFQSDSTICIVREYVEGKPLNQYIAEKHPSNQEIIGIAIALCDILIYLHSQQPPVIHRDIKPQNVIIKDDGQVVLIDFDIARVYNSASEADTQFFGTREYAPPEQYGFSQTDSRTDIYSFGILLRYMLTESEHEESNIHIYKPLARIIKKCTAFAPKERFTSAEAVKKALLAANPKSQRKRKTLIALCAAAVIVLCIFSGVKWYQYATFDPFSEGSIPAVMTDEERVSDAVSYMNGKYGTDLFDDTESYADIGFVKTVLTDVYGYDSDYAHAIPSEEGPPHESDNNFLPWGMGDEQYVARDVMVYVAVKIYWVDKVSDYSSLKDDNGYYPGVRVAVAFAEETGILTGVGRPEDITKGEAAILLANADRVFEATKE